MNPFKAFTSIRLMVILIVLGRSFVQGDFTKNDNANSDAGSVTKLTQIVRPMEYAGLSDNSVEIEGNPIGNSRNQLNKSFDNKLSGDYTIYGHGNANGFHKNVGEEKAKHLIVEGRGKNKGDNMGIPFLIGYKTATAVTMMFAFMKMLVFKALLVAKIALALSAILTFYKLFEGGSDVARHSAFMEIEHHASDHAPVYMEFPHGGNAMGYHPSSSANYYAYSNFIPSGNGAIIAAGGGGAGAVAAESQNYATVEASGGTISNGSNTNQNQQAAGNISKRRSIGTAANSDLKRKSSQVSSPTIITVKRITTQS